MYSKIETQRQQLTSCMDSIQEHFEKHPQLKYISCQTRFVELWLSRFFCRLRRKQVKSYFNFDMNGFATQWYVSIAKHLLSSLQSCFNYVLYIYCSLYCSLPPPWQEAYLSVFPMEEKVFWCLKYTITIWNSILITRKMKTMVHLFKGKNQLVVKNRQTYVGQ